jgi:hypothetical protein
MTIDLLPRPARRGGECLLIQAVASRPYPSANADKDNGLSNFRLDFFVTQSVGKSSEGKFLQRLPKRPRLSSKDPEA